MCVHAYTHANGGAVVACMHCGGGLACVPLSQPLFTFRRPLCSQWGGVLYLGSNANATLAIVTVTSVSVTGSYQVVRCCPLHGERCVGSGVRLWRVEECVPICPGQLRVLAGSHAQQALKASASSSTASSHTLSHPRHRV